MKVKPKKSIATVKKKKYHQNPDLSLPQILLIETNTNYQKLK